MSSNSNHSSTVLKEEEYRAHLYQLLARLLDAPADSGLLELLAGLDGDDSPLGQAIGALSEVAENITLEEAVEEYNELFIGVTQGELLPYASYYLTGFLNEKPLAELRQAMDEIGVQRSEDASDPEDHIASLFEIMHGLIIGRFGRAVLFTEQISFFDEHIKTWAPKFFEDLEAAQAARLFMPVGLIGKLFLEIESEAFKIAA